MCEIENISKQVCIQCLKLSGENSQKVKIELFKDASGLSSSLNRSPINTETNPFDMQSPRTSLLPASLSLSHTHSLTHIFIFGTLLLLNQSELHCEA